MKAHDGERDLELSAALHETVPAPPVDAVDWVALQTRIAARAAPILSGTRRAPLLAGVRPPPSVWGALSDWAGSAVPVMLATTAALALALGLATERTADPAVPTFYTLEEELAADLGNAAGDLLADASDDELTETLLFYDMEER